jgi:WS/DGAT/MGAT family acyltransferase
MRHRLSAVDASFLTLETPQTHMHIGAVMVFEGPPPDIDLLRRQFLARMPAVPRFRQKLAIPPLGTHRPVWTDDPHFNIEYHVRHTGLPRPGGMRELSLLTARLFSQQLDRAKPLWECSLVEGLDDDRFAVITKTHHAMVDGVSGIDISTVIFDLAPTEEVAPPVEPWTPEAEPGALSLAGGAVRDRVAEPVGLMRGALNAALHPRRTISEGREVVEGLGEVLWAGLNAAPETPLNVEIGPHRRVRFVRAPLADYKAIKNALGGTVNDVILAQVAGALRAFFSHRGVRPEGLEPRALVPVSVRGTGASGALGNQITVMRAPLPVYVPDAAERLRVVREHMGNLKESKQALGARSLTQLAGFAPPTVLAQAARVNFSTRLFNLIVTNVPGPQFPLYLLGRELAEVYPVAFLPRDHAVAIAVMSYNGTVGIGLLGDAMEEAFAELVAAAERPPSA